MSQLNYPNYNYSYGNYQQQSYQPRYSGMQPDMQPRYDIIRVSGENGAKAFGLPPNSSVILLDETAPIVWLKTTDGAGYPTLTPYTITPYQAAAQPDYGTLEARIKRLEDMLNEKPDVADVKPKKSAKSADTE